MGKKATVIFRYRMVDSGLLGLRVSIKMAEKIDIELIKTESNAAIVVFKTPSMSDVDAISTASTRIKEFVLKHQPRMLIFDFEAVRFFSSLVLGLLLDIRGKMEESNGEVLISSINPHLHRVFKITNLDKVFRFFPDRHSAIEAIASD
jgi:anti-anti-sigma factor